MRVNPIPKGYHTVTPYLLTEDADQLIDFLKAAFGASTTECVCDKQGRTMHGEVKIGDSIIMVGGKKDAPMSSAMLYLYVEDTDATYQQALVAGGISIMEPTDQFYGDRNAGIQDPCGNKWWIATHIEDVPQKELEKRAQNYHASSVEESEGEKV